MIEVTNLSKKFAGTTAVDQISFSVDKGEIVGFLGPNGAGKTTTMRMLTGYLPATGGTVRVGGRDVLTESLAVRRNIGYLPEHCPLYNDMRVNEYLHYRAKLKGLTARIRRRRVNEVMELCGLREINRRIIGQLSKGYRQRVGLADALVHEPDLLVLDEPTQGLDPNQIRHTRELIRSLAGHHTILLSTHILSEVEVTCQRVLIINQGKIVASEAPDELHSHLHDVSTISSEIQAPSDSLREALMEISGVVAVSAQAQGDWQQVSIKCKRGLDLRKEVFTVVAARGWVLRSLDLESRSLEDAFVEITRQHDEESGA